MLKIFFSYLQKHLYLSAENGLSPYPDLLSCAVLLLTGFLFLFSTKVMNVNFENV